MLFIKILQVVDIMLFGIISSITGGNYIHEQSQEVFNDIYIESKSEEEYDEGTGTYVLVNDTIMVFDDSESVSFNEYWQEYVVEAGETYFSDRKKWEEKLEYINKTNELDDGMGWW